MLDSNVSMDLAAPIIKVKGIGLKSIAIWIGGNVCKLVKFIINSE
jgi:hypothetical protein